jgi:4-hydroxybenzoate polyprenyltransferase
MEDLEGDRQFDCRTMPIKGGIDKTKYFLYVLILFTIGALYFLNQSYISFDGNLTIRYITVGIVLPLVILGIETGLAKKKEDFHQASTLAKFTMLMGVIYSLIFSYLTAKANGISLFGLFIVK